MKHTDKPGGVARKLRPLTEAESQQLTLSIGSDPIDRLGRHAPLETAWAIDALASVGFFNPSQERRQDGRAWNDTMHTIALLRALATFRNGTTGECFPGYEKIAIAVGVPGARRHVERLCERLLHKTGLLGRTFRAFKGSQKTRRYYDFSTIEAAAEIVEGGWMPTIDPPAWACTRSSAETNNSTRSSAETIATAPTPNPCNRSAPSVLQPLPPRTLATAKGAAANMPEHPSIKHALCLKHEPAASDEDLALKGHDARRRSKASAEDDEIKIADEARNRFAAWKAQREAAGAVMEMQA